ncbi:MAG: hypothetical protein K6F14_03500 [Clostridiales bacterium]|nr:hypothetical protein [Clostridiales bacterium]
MKKILMFSYIIILAVVLCMSASAGFLDELFPNGEYPDDVGAYFYGMTGYNAETPEIKPHQFYVVYMVEGTGNDRLEEIRSFLGEGETIEFRYCKRSYNFYSDLAQKIGSEFKPSVGEIKSIGVGISSDNTFLVIYVTENPEKIQSEIDAAYPKYNGEIQVNYYDVTTGIDEVANELYSNPVVSRPDNSNGLIWLVAVASVVLIGAGLVTFVLLNRRKRVLVTSNGDEITEGSLSAKTVEDAVAVGQEPSDRVYDGIKKRMK